MACGNRDAPPRVAASDPELRGEGFVAPSAGLLLLGAVFGNLPIELRHLAFAAPFAAGLATILLAQAAARVLAAGRRRISHGEAWRDPRRGFTANPHLRRTAPAPC